MAENQTYTQSDQPDDGGEPSKVVPVLLGVLIGVLATMVVVLLVMAITEDDDEDAAPGTTTSSTTSSATTSSTTPTTVADGDLRGVALRLDVLLDRSAQARSDAVEVIAAVQDECGMDPNQASTRLFEVEESRQDLLSELSSLQVTGNEEADRLVALLLAALQDSQFADQRYLAWVNSEYGRFFYDNSVWDENTGTWTTDCPGPPPKTEDWDDAVAASGGATAAKQAFVAEYNPVAERFGLRVWSDTEI